jgi:hypothetical protein
MQIFCIIKGPEINLNVIKLQVHSYDSRHYQVRHDERRLFHVDVAVGDCGL